MNTKYCNQCKTLMVRPRWANGKLDSTFRKRLFCSRACYGNWIMANNKALTKNASRRRAQRAFPKLPNCQKCGTNRNIQRHHRDHQNALCVEFLCPKCHAKTEIQQNGTWGRGLKKEKTCTVCGLVFSNYTHSRVKTCSRECLSEIGRRNASKRWGAKTEYVLLETPSCQPSHSSSAKRSTSLKASKTKGQTK